MYADHPVLEPLLKRNRSNQQYSARISWWLDRLAHFDIAVQQIASSNLIFTNVFSRNPGAAIEEKYDGEYVINILNKHVALNAKYDSLIDSQSNFKTEENGKEQKQN